MSEHDHNPPAIPNANSNIIANANAKANASSSGAGGGGGDVGSDWIEVSEPPLRRTSTASMRLASRHYEMVSPDGKPVLLRRSDVESGGAMKKVRSVR